MRLNQHPGGYAACLLFRPYSEQFPESLHSFIQAAESCAFGTFSGN